MTCTGDIAKQPIFVWLLLVDNGNQERPNIKNGDPYDVYLSCAVLCAKSVAYHGYQYIRVTNNASYFKDKSERSFDRGVNNRRNKIQFECATKYKISLGPLQIGIV
jgi:hypothetical protein